MPFFNITEQIVITLERYANSTVNYCEMSIHIGYRSEITDSYTSSETLKIRYAQLTRDQVRLIKSSWEMVNDDFMKNSQLLFSKLMKEAPDSIDLFTFAKGSGMYNPNYELDMKRHSLKVVNALCWAVSKCDKFEEIKPDLISLGERHRHYGLKLVYILPMQAVIINLVKEYLGHLFNKDLELAWTAFLRILLYTIFHPLLRRPNAGKRQRIFLRSLDGKILAVLDIRVFVFWVVVFALLVGWTRITIERYMRF
ncbi:hypothetical protein ACHWQZ_G005805 [Mnemiopsis leidyi]